MPPRAVKEEYRYAKLDKNDKIFEIKTDTLGEVTVPLEELRDPLLARRLLRPHDERARGGRALVHDSADDPASAVVVWR